MKITQQNQTFGAIRITPQPPLNKQATLLEMQNESNLRLIDPDALSAIYQTAGAYLKNVETTLGSTNGIKSWNIKTKKGSNLEETVIEKLNAMFKEKRISFQAESISDQAEVVSVKEHDMNMEGLFDKYMPGKKSKL